MIDLAAIPTDQLHHMAAAAASQSNMVGSEVALRELARREPRNLDVMLSLTHVLSTQGARLDAMAMARRAAAIAPRDGRAQLCLANCLLMTGQMEAAARTFERLLRHTPNDVSMLASYGMTLERLRRSSEARAVAHRALAIDPRDGRALNLLGQLDTAKGNLDAAEASFERAIKECTDTSSRSMALHRLGALREKQERWDEAFECHDRGNRVQLGTTMARHVATGIVYTRLNDSMPESAAEMVARWKDHPVPADRAAPVFLVGFPRSGTTLTEQVLGAIPGTVTTDEEPVLDDMRRAAAAMCEVEDPAAAMEALDQLTDAQILELREIYWRAVDRMIGPDTATARLFIDKQPLRFVYAALLNRVFPDSKIIFVIRDPRDCCLSCFFQDFAPFGPMARSTSLDGIGALYAEVMTFWMRARTILSIPWMEMRYEDMVSDFEPHAKRLVEFVGHPWSDDILEFQKKASRRVIRTPSFRSVTEKVNTRAIGKWARYEKHLGPLIEQVRPFLEPLGYEE